MFKTNNARLSLMASIFAIIITLIGIFCVDNNQNVNAESMDIYMNQDEVDEELLEKYTNTDKLFDEPNKEITDFAQDVKSKTDGEEVKDLTKVIPEKYVRFVDDGYSFYYIGKEYGFFVNHREMQARQFIDVVLVDFTYNCNDIYCSNKITLLLQETLLYKDDRWFICHNSDFKKDYYIVNPSFISAIQNENALNFSDNGYNKKTDKGAIIQSATLNFEGIVLEKDGITSSEGKALIQSAFCGIIDNVMGLSMVFVACSSDDSGDDKATLTKIMASGEFKTSYLEGEDFEKSNCKWANFCPFVFICFSSGYI